MKLLCVLTFVAFVAADVSHLQSGGRSFSTHHGFVNPGPSIRILQSDSYIDPNGNYKYAYKTENGISAQEEGVQRAVGSEGGTAAQGSYQYTSPEGLPVLVQYVADENGFRPVSDVLPTAPPIPLAILRALKYIAAHPESQ